MQGRTCVCHALDSKDAASVGEFTHVIKKAVLHGYYDIPCHLGCSQPPPEMIAILSQHAPFELQHMEQPDRLKGMADLGQLQGDGLSRFETEL